MRFLGWCGSIAGVAVAVTCILSTAVWAGGSNFGDDDDPEADEALFEAIEKTVRPTSRRRVQRVRANINDAAFVDAAVEAFDMIAPAASKSA